MGEEENVNRHCGKKSIKVSCAGLEGRGLKSERKTNEKGFPKVNEKTKPIILVFHKEWGFLHITVKF